MNGQTLLILNVSKLNFLFKFNQPFKVLNPVYAKKIIEPQHEISNNVVCATSKGSDQPAHMRSLIRAFASRLNIL